MNTGELLIRAALASPEDDLPRLVYADWCDENGQGELAEFIRVQCRVPQIEAMLARRYPDQDLCSEVSASWCPTCGDCCCPDREDRMDDPNCPLHSPTSRHAGDDSLRSVLGGLKRRELELWKSIEKKQFAPWHKGLIVYSSAQGSVGGFRIGERGPQLMTRRGFVSEVTCTLAEWCEICLECGGYGNVHASEECRGEFTGIGPEVVKRHPVEKVVLTDREPDQPDDETGRTTWLWWSFDDGVGYGINNRDTAPPEFNLAWDEFGSADYPTRELANEALSDAAIQWAKSQMT